MRISDWSSDVCSSDLTGGPYKACRTAISCDVLCERDLFFQPRYAAMELEKQMRLLGQAGIAIQVERFDGDRVYKLATGHRYAQLYDLNNGLNSGSDVGKGADRKIGRAHV